MGIYVTKHNPSLKQLHVLSNQTEVCVYINLRPMLKQECFIIELFGM